jgi:isopenicillin-N N-acyltransferase-like protein
LRHGSLAKSKVHGSIKFYKDYFKKTSGLDWTGVLDIAQGFVNRLESTWPEFIQEMQGIADGAEVTLNDIVALNVRTEIAFGLYKPPELMDGCTSLYWKTETESFLSQNWDWLDEQRDNIIVLRVYPKSGPKFQMVTEAGIIGKIGLNEHGVGCCLNAIKAQGVDNHKVPVHLALRIILNSRSKNDALEALRQCGGVASSAHILLADQTGGIGLEYSAYEVQELTPDQHGRIYHSNHYLAEHKGVHEFTVPAESKFRTERIRKLAGDIDRPNLSNLQHLYKDEENSPGAICRIAQGTIVTSTLFNIVMTLTETTANVTLGRPVDPQGSVVLSF